MWKNTGELGSPQMARWRMRIAFWIPKAIKNTQYVKHIAFPLQQWLHERPNVLRHKYLACLASSDKHWTELISD